MLIESNVVLTIIVGKSSVSVEAETLIDDRIYAASGTSKCDAVDTFDPATGFQLAIGRAIRQLGRDIYKVGNEKVHAADKVRAKQKAEQERLLKVKQAKAKAARKQFLSEQKKSGVSKTLAKVAAKR